MVLQASSGESGGLSCSALFREAGAGAGGAWWAKRGRARGAGAARRAPGGARARRHCRTDRRRTRAIPARTHRYTYHDLRALATQHLLDDNRPVSPVK